MKLSNLLPLLIGAEADYTLTMRLCTKKGSRTGVIEEAQGNAKSFYIALDGEDFSVVNLPYHQPKQAFMTATMPGDIENAKTVRVCTNFDKFDFRWSFYSYLNHNKLN